MPVLSSRISAVSDASMVSRKKEFRVTILPGDGIGPEVVAVGVRILLEVGRRFSLSLHLEEGEIGRSAVERSGVPLGAETLEKARRSDAVLLGAVGGSEPDRVGYSLRPEAGLLALRKGLDLFANLRPVKVLNPLLEASPLKAEVVAGVDLLVVRELVGGIYFGEPKGRKLSQDNEELAFNTMSYTTSQIERVARTAFDLSRGRKRRVVSVDKANVLEVSLLWREVVSRVQREYLDVELTHQYVDNCAMQLIRNPRQFDVILTENLFGDILSDEAAVLAGSIGMLPSASLGSNGSLFEPVHGSAPDIAGRDVANPLATVLSVAMMFRYAFGLPEASGLIEEAVLRTLGSGYRTADIFTEGSRRVGTREMGEKVLDEIARLHEAGTS